MQRPYWEMFGSTGLAITTVIMTMNTVLHSYLFLFVFFPFQMVASSQQAARKLLEKSAWTNDETRANNGLLIG